MIQCTGFNSSHFQKKIFTLFSLRIHNSPKPFLLFYPLCIYSFFLLECLTRFNSLRLQPNRIEILMFQLCWCTEISFYFLFYSLNNGPKKFNYSFFSLKMHYNVQLPASWTKSNQSFDVLDVLIRRNFSSPVLQTASSTEAMPSFSSLLPFARLDVNPGWQLCKLKHRAAQIKTKIASAPRMEGWESGSSRGKRRRTERGGRESSPW